MNAGMNVARLNFSHGSYKEHLKRIGNIKIASRLTDKVISILLDTEGLEVRTHVVNGGSVSLVKDSIVRVSMEEIVGNENKISISYPKLIQDIQINQHILLND